MRKLKYFGLLLLIYKFIFSQTSEIIPDFSYNFSVSPNINEELDDPNRTKLKDGDPKTKVAWCKQRPFVEIEISLPSTYLIDKVEVYTYRPNTGWFIKKIGLYIDEGKGFEFVNEINTGQTYGCPIDVNPKVFPFEDIKRQGNRVKLRIENDGGYFSLTDIKLYGTVIKREKEISKTSTTIDENYYKNIPFIKEGVKIDISNFDKDNDEEIFMGNKYFSLVIEPKLGGVISLLKYYKSGVNFTCIKSYENLDGGMLSDHVTAQGYAGDWYKSPYEYKIIENTKDKVKIKLSCRGKTGALSFITFNKYITVYSNKSYVEVEYEVENDRESLIDLSYELWFHNFAGTNNWRKRDSVFFYYPTTTGIIKKDLSQEEGSDIWFHNPARGWCGFIDNSEKVGLFFSIEYKYLKCFYNWKSSASIIPTLEWRFNEVEIPCGGNFKTKIYLMPFSGLKNITGAKNSLVGDIYLENSNKLKVSLISGEEKDGFVEIMYKILPEEKWVSLSKERISFKPDEIINKEIPIEIKKEGTYIFRCVISKENDKILDFENIYINKNPSGIYTLLQEEPQYMIAKKEKELSYKSEEIKTPHIKWNKPYYKGKTKCLILCESHLTRDIIELAQRIDIELETTYIYTYDLEYGVGDYVGVLREKDLKDGVKNILKNYDWDVLIITGGVGRFFDEDDKKDIFDKIKNGKGLIVIEPEDNGFNSSILPLNKKDKLMNKVKWNVNKDHFITKGLPFEILPPTDIYTYKNWKDVEVIISGNNQPILSITNLEKGRIVVFTYKAGTTQEKDKPYGLLPLMRDLYYEIVSEYPNFDYHEYHFSLLGKAILWAAKKEPYLSIENIKFEKDKLIMSLNTEKDEKVSIMINLKNKYGEVKKSVKKEIEVKKGENEINFNYNSEFYLLNGLNILDIFIKNVKGEIINWHSISYNKETFLKIKTITLDKNYYKADEKINLKLSIEGEIDNQLVLNLLFKDGFGRLIKIIKQNLDSKDKTFTISFDNLINSLIELTVTIEKNNEIIDISKKYIPIFIPPEKEEPLFFAWSIWVGYNRGVNSYLAPFYYEKLREIGINGEIFHNATQAVPSELYAIFKNNFYILWGGGGIGARPKTKGDPNYPQREAEIYELLEKHLSGIKGIKNLNFKPIEIFAGDENKFAYLDQEIDFSPSYLQKFREYLKEKYKSIEKLNLIWETNYKTWEEVIPLTLKDIKIKGSKNYSSWCDWRAFGDFSFAKYFNTLREEAEKIEPSIKLGISGTPEPDPYNGYDYYLLSKSLTAIQGYYGVNELYSFTDKNKFNLRRWLGGHKEADKTVKFSIYDLFFRGGNGINIWTSRLLFKPDGRYSKLGESIKKYYKPIKEGIGRILITSQLQKDPIGIVYSQNSLRISYAEGHFDLWRESKNSALKLIENVGFDPIWIADEQLAKGELKDVKVLILPLTSSISEEAMLKIKEFVEKGGLLIGQIRIGIADDYGKILKKGVLDDIFGIVRNEDNILIRKETFIKKDKENFEIPEVSVNAYEKGLKALKSICIGKTKEGDEVIFYNKYGKGVTIYIGCDLFPSYQKFNSGRNELNDEYASKIEKFINSLLFIKELKQKIIVVDEKGKSIPFVKTAIFKNGDIKYYCILREYSLAEILGKSPVKGKIIFDEKGFVYDILENKEYGFTNQVDLVLVPDSVKIFAFTPYRVEGIKITSDKKNYKRGEDVHFTIELETSGKQSGVHVIRMDIYSPDNKKSEMYSKNVTLKDKKELIIPLSLDEMSGKWKVEIRDLVSGRKNITEFFVNP